MCIVALGELIKFLLRKYKCGPYTIFRDPNIGCHRCEVCLLISGNRTHIILCSYNDIYLFLNLNLNLGNSCIQ